MKVKASIVVMSHLSNAQETINSYLNINIALSANQNINFAKWIILRTNGDLTKEIDPDSMYNDFLNLQK